MSSKAVIYIDTEDDITAIIDRVKAAKSDIVALVPPKRTGVLQSVVNLKLLRRAGPVIKNASFLSLTIARWLDSLAELVFQLPEIYRAGQSLCRQWRLRMMAATL